MGFLQYLRYQLWEFLFGTCATVALVYVACTGFDCTRPLQGNPLIIIGISALLTAYLCCISYRPLVTVTGSLVLLVALAGATVACWQAAGVASIVDDVAGNYAPFVLIEGLAAVLVFVLSRRKVTLLVLLVGGVILCAAIEYLYFLGHLIPTLIFAAAVTAWYAYRNYQRNLLNSESESMSFGAASIAGLALCIVALAAGVGIFTLCIQPLNPPNIVVKLITQHVRVDTEDVRGVGDSVSVENDKLFSNNVNEQIDASNAGSKNASQGKSMEDAGQNENGDATENSGGAVGLSADADQDAGGAVSLEIPSWLCVAILPGLLIFTVAVIVIRKLLRRRRWRAIVALPPQDRMRASFLYFMRCFQKMKVQQPGTLTLGEYLISVQDALQSFEQTTDAPRFNRITKSYCDVAYGNAVPSSDELSEVECFHDVFYRRARKFRGGLRYLWLFFRI